MEAAAAAVVVVYFGTMDVAATMVGTTGDISKATKWQQLNCGITFPGGR